MLHWFAEMLRHHPEMALFLTLALGYLIGKIRFGSITLGAVVRFGRCLALCCLR